MIGPIDPASAVPSLFAKSDTTRFDHSQSKQMITANVRKTYTEISNVLLTLHGDFNSIAHKGS
jgi:hypothetical protein